MKIRLIGIDCATDDAKVGIAFGFVENGKLTVDRAFDCSRKVSPCVAIAEWLRSGEGAALLALDAPLGWPVSLSRALANHEAGATIAVPPDQMFHRTTDRTIHGIIRKKPLEVGADRIARTAHAALRLLGDLRRDFGLSIPLAWDADFSATIAAIEVYPAATLISHGFQSDRYKKPDDMVARDSVINRLRTVAALPPDVSSMQSSADALDAAVCLLAAADFLNGRAIPPEDRELAEREGWIWVCEPKQGANRPSSGLPSRMSKSAAPASAPNSSFGVRRVPQKGCLGCEHRTPTDGPRVCPLCGHSFRGNGWDGIDAHWRARHEKTIPYEHFWESLCAAHRG